MKGRGGARGLTSLVTLASRPSEQETQAEHQLVCWSEVSAMEESNGYPPLCDLASSSCCCSQPACKARQKVPLPSSLHKNTSNDIDNDRHLFLNLDLEMLGTKFQSTQGSDSDWNKVPSTI